MSKQIVLHLDMDGVLADFDGTYLRMFGESPDPNLKRNDPVTYWDRWNKFVASNGFMMINPTPWCRDLLRLVYMAKDAGLIDDVRICSSAGGQSTTYEQVKSQKLAWLKAQGIHYDATIVPNAYTKYQGMVQGAKNVLLDDKEYVLREWKKHGGVGVLWQNSLENAVYNLNRHFRRVP